MPKKKDKKQDEDKKTKKKESVADKTEPDDSEKDLYRTQIRYLNEQLERYQLKCDELEKQRKDFDAQYNTLEKEKKDIVQYLKRALLEKEDEVDELSERMQSQRQAAEKDRDALQLQHSQLRQELQDHNDKLAAVNVTLVARLANLEEFQKQKEQLITNMESLEKQLSRQEEEHKATIHSLEMKALLEKKRLETEMESHVAAMAAEVQHLVDQKVPETTRLTVQENNEVKARFSQLSEQAQVLVEENTALRVKKSQLSVDVDILEQTLSGITRESCIRKKVVGQLTEKCQHLQVKLNDSRQEVEQLQTEHKGVLAELEALRLDRAAASEQCDESRAEVSQLEAELLEERRRRIRTKSNMQEAAVTLRQVLMEAHAEQDPEVDSVVQWRQLMQKLLVVLDRPAPLRNDSSLTGSTAESEQVNELQTSDPAAAARNRAEGTINPALSFQLQLGLAPRPALKHKHVLTGTGAGPSSTHLPLHRKPAGQKTTRSANLTQTDSSGRFLTSRNSFAKHKSQ
ncbi:cilia- and flagella-associated protein 157 [Scomber scombrus]|uniref:cilia- and flagella-associated protein 157 n=1 Tax=Scomber scombrus TaxID=13677 RepID=UPI002DD98BEF|nr:cilia- and flagella-associated protein 157 [Scomber scombrus]